MTPDEARAELIKVLELNDDMPWEDIVVSVSKLKSSFSVLLLEFGRWIDGDGRFFGSLEEAVDYYIEVGRKS